MELEVLRSQLHLESSARKEHEVSRVASRVASIRRCSQLRSAVLLYCCSSMMLIITSTCQNDLLTLHLATNLVYE
jgi:hypothetical protein